MHSVNRVTLIGHLGAKPQNFTAQNGRNYTRLSVATNREWKDDGDVTQKRTDWHFVMAWGKLAELCIQYLDKGSLVYVDGYITCFDNQKNPTGPRYTTITATTINFLNRREEENQAQTA